MIAPVMGDHLSLLLLAALILGGSGLAIVVLRPRPRELRLPREEEEFDVGEAPERSGEPRTIELVAKEIEPDRPPRRRE